MPAVIANLHARRLFLDRHALAQPPTGPSSGASLAALIDAIGFVQVDSINTVERAHHMILFSRRQSYRPENLKPLLEHHRTHWEHWTHDASILPTRLFPLWQHRFARNEIRMRNRITAWFPNGDHSQIDTVRRHISDHGPVTTSDFAQGEPRSKGGWWDWHPSKSALEWLWHTGQLAITRRDGFQKVYDLTERVIPPEHRTATPDTPALIDWACTSALDQLGFADIGELWKYWNAITPLEARHWAKQALARGDVIEIDVQGADGALHRSLARPDILTQAATAPDPPTRLRILSPFDPALRDRDRAQHLFGFLYRIEVFVPEPKRKYGYYVFPVLEGSRIVGRIDVKAFKDDSVLRVKAFWPEPGIAIGPGRQARLDAELGRLAQFTGCDRVHYLDGWQRETLA